MLRAGSPPEGKLPERRGLLPPPCLQKYQAHSKGATPMFIDFMGRLWPSNYEDPSPFAKAFGFHSVAIEGVP